MNRKPHRRASWFLTMGLLLAVSGAALPSSSAAPAAGLSSGWLVRVSVASDGTQSDEASYAPSISAGGRYVAFGSGATNLVGGDTNNSWDVFVHDRQTGETQRVSVASDAAQGDGESRFASISGSGRYVAFESSAANLAVGDTNGEKDILLHDRQTGENQIISVASDGTQGDDESYACAISADGRFVAFTSYATNLVEGDTNDKRDVFLHDSESGQTSRVSVASGGAQGADWSGYPSLSADGRYVAFYSYVPDLVAGDDNDTSDVFVHDRQTAQTTCVSVAPDGMPGDGRSYGPSISADGRYVAFESDATNLVAGDTNGQFDVFIHDRQTGETTRVSVASDGTEGDLWSSFASISTTGRYVAFDSPATNLVAGDTNGEGDVFVHDRQTGETRRASVASDGTQGDDRSYAPSISAFGDYVAFHSHATTLVLGDTNGRRDIFLHGPWFRVHLPLVVKNYWRLSILLGQEDAEQGLYQRPCPDADTLPDLAGTPPSEGRRTGNGLALDAPDGNQTPDFYMQFDADDGTLYQAPSGTRLAVVVTYLDEGSDTFSIQYDGHTGGPWGDGRFKDTGNVSKTGTGEWRTHTFWLDDVYFGNRDNEADFRIDDHGNGAEVIRRVTVHP
jgi:Tol biopolymer transport system component